MLDTITNIKTGNFTNIYHASDFHYNHQRDFIWTPRGFKTYQEHDAFLEAECEKLLETDLLIYYGDLALNTTIESVKNILFNKIKAKVMYFWGNHEGKMRQLYKECLNQLNLPPWLEVYPLYVDPEGKAHLDMGNKPWKLCFEGRHKTLKTDYFTWNASHMAPYIWQGQGDRWPAICGHSHGNCPLLNLDHLNGKLLDVGVDNALRHNGTAFFHHSEVQTILRQKNVKIYDHHGNV